ncbi:MAG: hypothetical protein WAT78_09160 [Rhizobiaceae bacterium]
MGFLFRLIRGIIRWAMIAVLLIAAIPLAGLAYGFATTHAPVMAAAPAESRPPAALRAEIIAAIPDYQRTEESTFLTYPEWAIVYAAREYAGHLRTNRESSFPYLAYAGRYWQDYAVMIEAADAYPFNFSNHLMLVVIGTSHTIEHLLQGAWENTIGRLTEAASAPTAEDAYQAAAAAEYAAFLDQTPWYRFDYKGKRAGLWAIPAATSPGGAFRSWERKLAFSLSYRFKEFYAGLINQGLDSTSAPALLDIHVWAKGPLPAFAGEPTLRIERDFGPDGLVFVTPRYQVFTDMVPRLISRGATFSEIGGNGLILATILTQGPPVLPNGLQSLFSYALPARPDIWRTGIALPVATLHLTLPALSVSGAGLEHLYDY